MSMYPPSHSEALAIRSLHTNVQSASPQHQQKTTAKTHWHCWMSVASAVTTRTSAAPISLHCDATSSNISRRLEASTRYLCRPQSLSRSRGPRRAARGRQTCLWSWSGRGRSLRRCRSRHPRRQRPHALIDQKTSFCCCECCFCFHLHLHL